MLIAVKSVAADFDKRQVTFIWALLIFQYLIFHLFAISTANKNVFLMFNAVEQG